MADVDKIGSPWTDEELDAIVEDYFAMLGDELAGHRYVKSHRSAALMARIGRTHRSVEFKHQNISAVLEELGLPWIVGYKPKRNYQGAIFDAIDRYLSRRPDFVSELAPSVAAGAPSTASPFVAPPKLEPNRERPARLERLVRKFDPVERDFRNRRLGKAGEKFVVQVEQSRLRNVDRSDLADKIRWVSAEDGDGAGFDILSFDDTGQERLIEVKTTNGAARTPFFLTRREADVAREKTASWHLYRVHFFSQDPRIFTIRPPLETALHLRSETWRASFS